MSMTQTVVIVVRRIEDNLDAIFGYLVTPSYGP